MFKRPALFILQCHRLGKMSRVWMTVGTLKHRLGRKGDVATDLRRSYFTDVDLWKTNVATCRRTVHQYAFITRDILASCTP